MGKVDIPGKLELAVCVYKVMEYKWCSNTLTEKVSINWFQDNQIKKILQNFENVGTLDFLENNPD